MSAKFDALDAKLAAAKAAYDELARANESVIADLLAIQLELEQLVVEIRRLRR